MNPSKETILEEINNAKIRTGQIDTALLDLEAKKDSMSNEEYENALNTLTEEKKRCEEFIAEANAKIKELEESPNLDIDDENPDLKEKIDLAEQEIKRQRDYSESGQFMERSNNIVKNSGKTLEKLSSMADEYNKIPMNLASKKAEIIREKENITSATIEERKAKMDNVYDAFEKEIEAIENNSSLTDEEKEQEKAKKQAELDEQIFLIEEYPNLSMKEQDAELDRELESIDKAIYEEQKLVKKKMAHVMTMQILLLGRYLKKGYQPKEIYEALKVLAEIKLDDKDLEKFMHNTFDETLLRNPELQRIYIAYSEKKAFDEEKDKNKKTEPEKNPVKTGVDAIEELLNEAEKKLDGKALDKACDLISKMPNGDDKNDLQARAAEIDKLIREKDNDKDLGGDGDDLDPPKPELPKIESNSPKKTWKTWVALAAGIGVGAAVFFTCGTVGVSVMAIAGGIAKRLIAKRRKKLEMQRLNGELPVESAEEPLPGIKGKIQKLKEYFKSEEFCRDATWFLNGAIYTGLGLNIASSIYNIASAHLNPTDVQPTNPTPNPTPDLTPVNNPTPVNTNPLDGIRIGDNVGGYNVSVGHDTASWATSGTHTESLISDYVNSGSIFKRFAVMNPDGSVGQIINTNGLSITDFCNQAGIDPSQIAVDVASKGGTSQAWVSTSELLKGVGGKTL